MLTEHIPGFAQSTRVTDRCYLVASGKREFKADGLSVTVFFERFFAPLSGLGALTTSVYTDPAMPLHFDAVDQIQFPACDRATYDARADRFMAIRMVEVTEHMQAEQQWRIAA